MVGSAAWFLNLDADEELARPAGYAPSRAVAARAAALVQHLGPLLRPGDVVIWPDGAAIPGGRPPGLAGLAWCPTPRALRGLARAGAVPPPAPPLDVLRRVNHRRFCAELGQPLPGARYATTLAEVESVIAGSDSPTGHWLLKRPFGFAGRGRRRVAEGALEPAARPWVVASLSSGEGLQVEPWVERRGDFSLHGHVSRGGEVALGEPCVQRCDAHGAFVGASRAAPSDLAPVERGLLVAAAIEAGAALGAAGYHGPFGIDAFRWEDAGGSLRWNPRCEINARYTMAWATGMGGRPDL